MNKNRKISRREEADQLALQWSESIGKLYITKVALRPPRENELVTTLGELYRATGEAVFAKAVGRVFELGLDGKDFRQVLNKMQRNRLLTASSSKAARAVEQELERGCSQQAACERVAVSLRIGSKTFDGAVKKVLRNWQKWRAERAKFGDNISSKRGRSDA